MTDVIDININKPKPQVYAMIAMCLACCQRWSGWVPEGTNMFNLKCPACHVEDSFASFIPEGFINDTDK